MTLVERMTTWTLSVGIKQLGLSEKAGFKFADHMRHLYHHIKWLRRCTPDQDGVMARHIVACSAVLSKIAFEASLQGLEIDHDELYSIQLELKQNLNTLLSDDPYHYSSDRLIDNLHLLSGDPN